MMSRIEDFLGRSALIIIFLFFGLLALENLVSLFSNPWGYDHWILDVLNRCASYVFMMLVVTMTLIRLPAKGTAQGIEPRLSAIAGTFTTLTLIVMPKGDIGPELKILALIIILTGTILSAYCLYFLGRSFSVMAHARRLVTHGPYSVVRHPLYAAEILTLIGVTLSNFSWQATVVILITIAFQFRRMVNEQRILRATFPEYTDYEKQVPMIIPELRLLRTRAQR